MPKIIKEAIIKEGVLGLLSKVYDKLILALILFLAAEGWGQYRQVDTNTQAVKEIREDIIEVAEELRFEIGNREALKVSFDSLLHCMDRKSYRDSINMSQIKRDLKRILEKK